MNISKNITNSISVITRGFFTKQVPIEVEQQSEKRPVFVTTYHGYLKLPEENEPSQMYVMNTDQVNLTDYVLKCANNIYELDTIPVTIWFVRANRIESLFDPDYINLMRMHSGSMGGYPTHHNRIRRTATIYKSDGKVTDILIDGKTLYDILWEDLFPVDVDGLYAYLEIELNVPTKLDDM